MQPPGLSYLRRAPPLIFTYSRRDTTRHKIGEDILSSLNYNNNNKKMLPLLMVVLSIVVPVQLVSSATQDCQGIFRAPEQCGLGKPQECTYQAFWQYRAADDSIEFVIVAANSGDSRWTGIGFTQDPANLTNVDFIFAWTEGRQRYVMMDAFLPNRRQAIPDKSQNIENIKVSVTNEYKTFKFSRKRRTSDSSNQDLSFADEECHYLIFPTRGGPVLRGHNVELDAELEPERSSQPVCIRACDYKPRSTSLFPPTTTTTTTSSTTTSTTTTTRAPTTTAPPPPTTTTRQPTTTTTTSTTTTSTTPKPTTTTTTTRRPTTTTTTTSTTTTTPAPTSSSSSSTTTTTTTAVPLVDNRAAPAAELQNVAASDESLVLSQTNPQQWCIGRWSYPAKCRVHAESFGYVQRPLDSLQSIEPVRIDQGDCTYYSQWQYHEPSDTIEFIIQTRSRNRWTGIGFSNSTHMANSDAIIGLFDESKRQHFIMDTWLQNHTVPELDAEQNIEEQQQIVTRKHQTTTFRFKRKRVTGDGYDFQFTDDSCAYFFFPVEGGAFNFVNKRIQRHQSVPIVSKQRICIKSCSSSQNSINNKDLKLTNSAIESSTGPLKPSSSTTSTSTSSTTTSTTTTTTPAPSESSADSQQPTTTQQPPQTTTTTAAASAPPSSSISLPPDSGGGGGGGGRSQLNDLQVDLDGSSISSQASSEHAGSNSRQQPHGVGGNGVVGAGGATNPLNRFAFLSEPSLRWLAGIGCIATLLAVIVFQACFTIYKNKQAYKKSVYRQSAYLHHEPYEVRHHGHHQPSTGSEETQTTSSIDKPSALLGSSAVAAGGGGGGAMHPSSRHQHSHHQAAAAGAANASQLNARSQLYRLSMAPYQLHRPQAGAGVAAGQQQQQQAPLHMRAGGQMQPLHHRSQRLHRSHHQLAHHELDPFESDEDELQEEEELDEDLEDELEEVDDEMDDETDDVMMDAHHMQQPMHPGGHHYGGGGGGGHRHHYGAHLPHASAHRHHHHPAAAAHHQHPPQHYRQHHVHPHQHHRQPHQHHPQARGQHMVGGGGNGGAPDLYYLHQQRHKRV